MKKRCPASPTVAVAVATILLAACSSGGSVTTVGSVTGEGNARLNVLPQAASAAASGSASATSATAAISGLHVVGNSIVNGAGQSVVLHGVNRSGTEFQCVQGHGFFDGPSNQASVAAIAAWHTNAVRVPLNEDCWLGINGVPAAYAGINYQNAIVAYVNLLNANGLAAILDLHIVAPGTNLSTSLEPMADADHAPAFWASVGSVFKANLSTIFDLYNEPYVKTWPCWLNGGTASACGTPYNIAGMNALIAAVRSSGAKNVVMAGGLAYANDLSQWLAYEPRDPSGNLTASWHAYGPQNGCSVTLTVSCNVTVPSALVAKVPIVAGETGDTDCAQGFIDSLYPYMDANRISYLAWAWTADFNCARGPGLVSDYNGTPTAYGIGVYRHFAALAAANAAPSAAPSAAPAISATATPTPAPSRTAAPTPKPSNIPTATPAPVSTSSPAVVSSSSAPPAAIAISGLHVVGNGIVDSVGRRVVLHGVNRAGTESQCVRGLGIFDGPTDAASIAAIAAWHVNAVRVPLNEDCWLGINGIQASYSGSSYRNAIVAFVDSLNASGLVAILDLQWSAPGSEVASGPEPMADADHAPAFWTSVAGAFKNDSSVIFDLFNEPNVGDWTCWQRGGTAAACGTTFNVAGMNTLIASVRAAGAKNVVMVGGIENANDLSQWFNFEPSDPAGNLAVSWHVFPGERCDSIGCYQGAIAKIAAVEPVVATSTGEYDCGHGFVDGLYPYLDANAIGYFGSTWSADETCSQGALVTTYGGSPSSYGLGLQDHLASLAAAGR